MVKTVHFFGDPMCSWCWGFSPELEKLADAAADKAALTVTVGGLRAFNTQTMDAQAKAEIRSHWDHVQEASGQPFDFALFDRDDFIYDTEPACRAVVTARGMDDAQALPMFEALHRAFYAEGRDITQTDILADVAADIRLDRAAFLKAFESDAVKADTQNDFARTQSFGVRGFPTVICEEDGHFGILTAGYRPYAVLAPLFEEWLKG